MVKAIFLMSVPRAVVNGSPLQPPSVSAPFYGHLKLKLHKSVETGVGVRLLPMWPYVVIIWSKTILAYIWITKRII